MAKGKKVVGDKRKRSTADYDPKNPHQVDQSNFMAASKEAAMAEHANRLQKEMEVAILLDLISQEGGHS